jgi:hypothetical protein
MAVKSRGARNERGKTVTKIRVSPFRLIVRPVKGGFTCDFIGTDNTGRVIEIELEFPPWWANEIISKLKGEK